MNADERIQVETAAHKARLAWAFVIFALFVIGVCMWITETPKRWFPLAVAIALACGGVLYACLR